VNGNVTWRPDGDTDWTTGTLNTPMRQGAQIWVGDGGRAEVQFDDGSVVRLGSGAVVTLQTLFSDSQGEFTELKMSDGLASMDLRTDHSIYQIDTPHGSVKSVGPSRVRVGVDDDTEVGVREGSATLDGQQGHLQLNSGDYVDVVDDTTQYAVKTLPAEDSWDQFTDERHDLMAKQDPNLPDNMQYVAGDLQDYGTWHSDSQYGKVWCPQESADWQPYHDGNWVWCDPFGWTWVGAEPWGWAPYHYGSWYRSRWGWAWVPGPRYQYWSPGVVSFSYYDDDVCWAPLAPFECVYPSAFGCGAFGLGWGVWFSIGCCGVWSPGGPHNCFEQPWNNSWVNHWHGWNGGGHGWDPHSLAASHTIGAAEWSGKHFVASNARFGATAAAVSNFGSKGGYHTLSGEHGTAAWTNGKIPTSGGREPMSGPVNVARPSAGSWSPSHTFTTRPQEGTGIISRPTVGSTNNHSVQRYSSPSHMGSRYSSAASAAAAARQSLGWTGRGTGSSFGGGQSRGGGFNDGSRGSGSSYGGGRSQGSGNYGGFSDGSRGSGSSYGGGRSQSSSGFGGGRSQGSSSGRSNRSWGISDHGGWTHVHSSSSSSSSHSSGGGGGRGGDGGGGSRGGGGGRGGH
jgi:hypothetical protein